MTLVLGPNAKTRGPRRLSHFRLVDLLENGYISPTNAAQYFKFAFVRCPWDRVVSTYRYLRIGGEFKRFVCDVLPNSLMGSRQYGYFVMPQRNYTHGAHGDCLVDFVGRFERISEDFQFVREKLGLHPNLPHRNRHQPSPVSIPSKLRQAALGLYNLNAAHFVGAFKQKEHHSNFRNYFDPESAAVVGELYKDDVSTFNYSFD